ncbi:VOC family protein [Halorientalis halophila]|uniref:VOC family protein n=1 Tax=Halorientalis halophila TaxID=3108499 RepID=UPI00300B0D92
MTEPAPALPEDTRVGRVALTVGDLDETLAFYRDVVGLEVHERDDDADGDRAVLGDGSDPLLVLREDASTAPRDQAAAGLFHTAFRVPSRTALGDALDRVKSRWRLDGASDHRVSEALYLSDPEGNGVEIYRDRPAEAWPIDDDGRVQMDTGPLPLDELSAAAAGDDRAPTGTTVGHVHLEVTDLAAARPFYVDGLGLNVRQEWADDALFLAAGEYHHHVGLNTWRGRSEPAGERGLAWFELVVPDEETLAAVEGRLTARDVGTTRRDGRLDSADPDGIEVRLRTER